MRDVMAWAVISALIISGCTAAPDSTSEGHDGYVSPGSIQLAEGKGAIAGLVVDDRFRPVSNAQILLLELGELTESTINGEFSFVDVEPGDYTLRTQAEGHDAKDERVSVEEGRFAEATIEARRINSQGSFLITEEYAGFIPCAVQVMFETIVGDCTGDDSGDSYRARFYTDFSQFGGNVSLVLTEMQTNHIGDYGVQIMWGVVETLNYGYYAIQDFYDTNYARMELWYNETNQEDWSILGQGVVGPWKNDRQMHTTVFLYGEGSEELRTTFPDTYPFTGVGVDLGVKLQFLVTAFIGDPPEDLDGYGPLRPSS